MPRNYKSTEIYLEPDPRFGSLLCSKIINKLMWAGKKTTAQRLFYDAVDMVAKKVEKEPLEIVEQAMENIRPRVEVRSKRVGGATYQVPVEVRENRRMALSIRWVIQNARKRSGRTMADKLTGEIMDAFNNSGGAIKKKEESLEKQDVFELI